MAIYGDGADDAISRDEDIWEHEDLNGEPYDDQEDG